MKTLGIRVKPNAVVVAIYDSSNEMLENVESIRIPKALSRPEALKYARNSILDVLREYEIEKAGLRIVESNSRTFSIQRIEIEGLIQEAFASSSLVAYYCGQISRISAKIGIERADFKRYIDASLDFEEIENWSDLSKEQREAVLVALGAEYA